MASRDGAHNPAATASAWLTIAAALLPAQAAASEARSRLICAAFDLHALEQVEAAGAAPGGASDELIAAVEALLSARLACGAGSFEEAFRTYGSIRIDVERVRWLR